MGILDWFKKKEQPKTIGSRMEVIGKQIIVHGYRNIAKQNAIAPTGKTSNDEILEIYKQVGTAFREASNTRNERIPAGHLNTIVLKFYQVYELASKEFFEEHIQYEVEKYLKEGLRDDYKRDLKLF